MTLAERYQTKRAELFDVLAANLNPSTPIEVSYLATRLKEFGEDFDAIAEDYRTASLEGKPSSHHSYSGK